MDHSKGTVGWTVEEVDRIVHEPARYMILSVLYVLEGADFQFLRTQTGLTKGNLSSHMTKLEDAGYVMVKKEFKGKKPHTMLRITKKGRKAFDGYRKKMRSIMD